MHIRREPNDDAMVYGSRYSASKSENLAVERRALPDLPVPQLSARNAASGARRASVTILWMTVLGRWCRISSAAILQRCPTE
jgi:hypothetical protein